MRCMPAICLLLTWTSAAAAQQLSGGPDSVKPLPSSSHHSAAISRGPSSISSQLQRAAARRADDPPASQNADARSPLERWYAAKDRLKHQYNFDFAVGYTAVYQRASDDFIGGAQGIALLNEVFSYLYLSPVSGVPTRDAAGGMVEFSGTWTFIRPGTPNKGFIAFSVENRHQLGTEVPPQNLFLEAGAFWPTATAYADYDLGIYSLYYEQYFADAAVGIRIGKTLPFTIYDYMSLKSSKTDFLNGAFNLNPAISWASYGFGVAGIVRPVKPLYVLAGIHDLNGGPTQGIETFFTEHEYFKAAEIGWDTKFDFGAGNFHALFWDTDARASTGTAASRGITIGGEQQFGRVLPFFRYGYSQGAGSALSHLVAGGVAFKQIFDRPNDVIGMGVSWGQPYLDELFVDQKAAEIYYRVQATDEFAITPSLQYIKDPPLNLDTDSLVLFALRGRAAF